MATSGAKYDASESPRLRHTSSGKPYVNVTTKSDVSIYLTEFRDFDAVPQQAVLSQPAINDRLVSVPKPYTLSDAEFWVNLQLKEPSNLPLQVLRSGDPETGTFIGCVSLMPKSSDLVSKIHEIQGEGSVHDTEGYELGYYLDPAWQGKGIMRAGVRALLGHYVMDEGHQGVTVLVLEENAASRGVVEGMAGWVREEEADSWVEWPVKKGGGRKKLLKWRWEA